MSEETARPRIQLSPTQVIASALAAITATVAASYLGVAGTVIGAAVASVLTVVGNAVYSHSIQRTSARVRTVVPAAGRLAPRPAPAASETAPRRARRPAWTVMAAACVGVFAGVLVVVTGVELVAGRPLTDVLHNKQGSGTSVLGRQPPRARADRDDHARRRHEDADNHGHRHAGDQDGDTDAHRDSHQRDTDSDTDSHADTDAIRLVERLGNNEFSRLEPVA